MEARTLGQFVEQEGVLVALRDAVTQINAQVTREAKAVGKQQKLPVVQCFTCTVPACCSSLVLARLYEGVLLAAELRAQGRDTPALREELAARAAGMEAAGPRDWRTPCLFLDARGRCSVYSARPTACGALYVYSSPSLCGDRGAQVQAYMPTAEEATATMLEEQFRTRLALRKKVGRRYLGVLPRMALLGLEAWDRTDFREYLRDQPWPDEALLAGWRRS